jgi:hypothetical protein
VSNNGNIAFPEKGFVKLPNIENDFRDSFTETKPPEGWVE